MKFNRNQLSSLGDKTYRQTNRYAITYSISCTQGTESLKATDSSDLENHIECSPSSIAAVLSHSLYSLSPNMSPFEARFQSSSEHFKLCYVNPLARIFAVRMVQLAFLLTSSREILYWGFH